MSGILQLLGTGGGTSISITIAGTNIDIATAALAAGWDGVGKVTAIVDTGTYVQASSTSVYALTIIGTFPSGVELINNGTIIGRGGNGGNGGYKGYSGGYYYVAPTIGQAGGPAIFTSTSVSIINNSTGIISGGGGGGGGGSEGALYGKGSASVGGSGGGGGIGVSAGGAGGVGYGTSYGNPGNPGTLTSNGSGGIVAGIPTSFPSGAGGAGAMYASTGATGGAAYTAGASGGGGGYYLVGNSYVAWTNIGTLYGTYLA